MHECLIIGCYAICAIKESRAVLGNSVFIWACPKLENILFHTWTTPCRIVSISTTCWRKFLYSRFAKFRLVLKSTRGYRTLFTSVNLEPMSEICRESKLSSEKSKFGIYHLNSPLEFLFQKMILRNAQKEYHNQEQFCNIVKFYIIYIIIHTFISRWKEL